MGNCGLKPLSSSKNIPKAKPISPSSTAKVIHVDDCTVDEYSEFVPAGNVLARSPGYFVCSGEDMELGLKPPAVNEREALRPGNLYFLLPLASSRRPLSLPDLCVLAAKASTALKCSSK